MVSGSDGDVFMGEDGMLHGLSKTVCDYCNHHVIGHKLTYEAKRLVALDVFKPEGEVHLRVLERKG
jgi:hypothetical protein